MTVFAFMASSCALKILIAEIFDREQKLARQETDKKRQRYEKIKRHKQQGCGPARPPHSYLHPSFFVAGHTEATARCLVYIISPQQRHQTLVKVTPRQ